MADRNIYDKYGVRPFVNLAGPATRYGGALMRSPALDAMREAAGYSVDLAELQAAASKVIARVTHAEAGIVTAGAAAALTLGTAACIAGLDIGKINRLPDTRGMKNEVVMPWHQISGYDHAIRAAGATLVGVGIPNDTSPPHQVHVVKGWEIEAAVTDSTAAIAYAVRPQSHPPFEEVVRVARKCGVPVIVDAAAEIGPAEHLHMFIDMGADLVCISGGKGIRGPQASGILCGRRDLIGSAVLQMLDMAGEDFEEWQPPESLIPRSRLAGRPEHGIGRGMKVSKEDIIGLLVALDDFSSGGFERDIAVAEEAVRDISAGLSDLAGVGCRIMPGNCGYPALELTLDEPTTGRSAREVVDRLASSEPSIRVNLVVSHGMPDTVVIESINLARELTGVITQSVRAALLDR